jgi:aspartate/methionine/tyrosine aminotransferase
MPFSEHKRPRLAQRLAGLRPSLYARILSRLQEYGGEVYPFHIGETHLLPSQAVQDALRESDDPAIHRYGNPQGILPLREAIAEDLRRRGLDAHTDDIVITHGATHGLNLACQAILDPGDSVLVLSPHWPLINSMIVTASATPVEVPFTSKLRAGKTVAELLTPHLGPRTRAIYVTSPNNPDGVVLTSEELDQLAAFCVEHDLYALIDEAYERFHYDERPGWLSERPGMKERAISVFTFSKSHRMTGLRVGFAVAPPDVRAALVRLSNISIYNVSMLMQRAALAALCKCEDDVVETVSSARDNAKRFAGLLSEVEGVDFAAPAGGAYVFANLHELLGDRDPYELLDACLDHGVVFAPGIGFGAAYGRWARFCYTAMDPEHLGRGAERLAEILTRFNR